METKGFNREQFIEDYKASARGLKEQYVKLGIKDGDEVMKVVDAINEIVKEIGCTPAQVKLVVGTLQHQEFYVSQLSLYGDIAVELAITEATRQLIAEVVVKKRPPKPNQSKELLEGIIAAFNCDCSKCKETGCEARQ